MSVQGSLRLLALIQQTWLLAVVKLKGELNIRAVSRADGT